MKLYQYKNDVNVWQHYLLHTNIRINIKHYSFKFKYHLDQILVMCYCRILCKRRNYATTFTCRNINISVRLWGENGE